VRDYADKLDANKTAEELAEAEKGMAEMSAEFRRQGAQLYKEV